MTSRRRKHLTRRKRQRNQQLLQHTRRELENPGSVPRDSIAWGNYTCPDASFLQAIKGEMGGLWRGDDVAARCCAGLRSSRLGRCNALVLP